MLEKFWKFSFKLYRESVLGTSSWGSRWKINGEEMEEVKVWFDRCM